MIKDIIDYILNIKSDAIKVKMISNLTDEFRAGRNPIELLELIESDDKEILSIALYILGEVIISCNITMQKIIKRLFILYLHEDSQIRYKTLINLASFAHGIDSDKLNSIYKEMCQDSDEYIRETAYKLLQSGHLR